MGAWQPSSGPETGHRLLQQDHRLDPGRKHLARNIFPLAVSTGPSESLSLGQLWTVGSQLLPVGLGSFVVPTSPGGETTWPSDQHQTYQLPSEGIGSQRPLKQAAPSCLKLPLPFTSERWGSCIHVLIIIKDA